MNKYLVKAHVSREGCAASLRFIPLEIFDLWKSYMQSAHDCQVRALRVSLWISAGAIEGPGASQLSSVPREPVVSVSLQKSVGSVTMPVERFFAEEEMERILPRFLAHYGIRAEDPAGMAGVQVMRGYFLQPGETFGDET